MSEDKRPGVSRRQFVKGVAAAGATAVAGPWVISSSALASSGELNVLMWSDYLPDGWKEEFESSTGIKLNHTGIGSNEEIINQTDFSPTYTDPSTTHTPSRDYFCSALYST